MDSKNTHSRKRAQKRTQKWAHVVVLAQIVVSCSENRAHEGGCQGALGHGHSPLFESGGAPFFWTISWSPFFTQDSNFDWTNAPKWPQNESYGELFSRKSVKMKRAFGLRRRVRIAYEPIPWSAQGDQKNEGKTPTYFRTALFSKKIGHVQKKKLQKVSRRVPPKRGWRLLGHLWSPKLIFGSESEPTASPKVPQGPKKSSKWSPKCNT